jgi:hypothetical protein
VLGVHDGTSQKVIAMKKQLGIFGLVLVLLAGSGCSKSRDLAQGQAERTGNGLVRIAPRASAKATRTVLPSAAPSAAPTTGTATGATQSTIRTRSGTAIDFDDDA